MDADIGNKLVPPTLDTTALPCNPCELEADSQNSQCVHLDIFLLFNKTWITPFHVVTGLLNATVK